jgi:hypothetical protein
MSNNSDKTAKKDDEGKSNPKVTTPIKKNDDNDWIYVENIVTTVQEVDENPKETSEDSK